MPKNAKLMEFVRAKPARYFITLKKSDLHKAKANEANSDVNEEKKVPNMANIPIIGESSNLFMYLHSIISLGTNISKMSWVLTVY